VVAPAVIQVDGPRPRYPEVIKSVPPLIPKNLHGIGLSETVGVQVVIKPDGRVLDAVVVTPSSRLLAEAAVNAVRQWEYRPTTMQGVPIYTTVMVGFTFTIA
jgi:protein TonB